jgi:hypothetical protein
VKSIEFARLRDALDPFVHPRSVVRKPRNGRAWPEDDRVTLEVDAGDFMRLQVLAGTVTVDDLRSMPSSSRPGTLFLDQLEEEEARWRQSREG